MDRSAASAALVLFMMSIPVLSFLESLAAYFVAFALCFSVLVWLVQSAFPDATSWLQHLHHRIFPVSP